MLPLIAAGIGAMLAGSYMQSRAMNSAARRQREEIARAQAMQAEYQRQAEARAMAQVEQFQAPERTQQFEQTTQQLEKEYLKPVQQAQPINNIETRTAGEVSQAYESARALSADKLAQQNQRLAAQMAGIAAAGRMRQREGEALGETARAISQIGNFARGRASVDDHAIREAGRPNASRMLIGNLLTTAGSMALGSGMSSYMNPAKT